ncbi:MAG: winged helix-turn-helix domain-containing protein [Parashewanella sp.]
MCEKGEFTISEIAQTMGVSRSNIAQLKERLIKLNALQLIEAKKRGAENLYKVTDKSSEISFGSGSGLRPENRTMRKGTLSQQIWNTFRMHGSVDKKLLKVTTTGSDSGLRSYVRCLVLAGYVKQVNQINRRKKGSCLKYKLIRDTGRSHPTKKPDGLWDQNTQTFYPFNKKQGASNE